MRYQILTDDANLVINTILDCIEKGKGLNGEDILTWEIPSVFKRTPNGLKQIKYIVHSPEQWGKMGGIKLKADSINRFILITFNYWNSFPMEERAEEDEKYILGRFTELILVHFYSFIKTVTIDLD